MAQSQDNITPLHDRVVLRRLPADEVSKGGIIIPDNAKEKPVRGEVIAVGNGKRDRAGDRVPMDVKAGDVVLFGKYAGTDFKLDDVEHVILREDEILAVLPQG